MLFVLLLLNGTRAVVYVDVLIHVGYEDVKTGGIFEILKIIRYKFTCIFFLFVNSFKITVGILKRVACLILVLILILTRALSHVVDPTVFVHVRDLLENLIDRFTQNYWKNTFIKIQINVYNISPASCLVPLLLGLISIDDCLLMTGIRARRGLACVVLLLDLALPLFTLVTSNPNAFNSSMIK